jgi:hypothetical protein
MTTPTTETPVSPDDTATSAADSATDLQPDSRDALAARELAGDVPQTSPERMILGEDEPAPTRPSSRCNVGRTEQKFRLSAGAALVAAAAFAPVSRNWRIALGILGTAELITGATRYCPISAALGINTCRADER